MFLGWSNIFQFLEVKVIDSVQQKLYFIFSNEYKINIKIQNLDLLVTSIVWALCKYEFKLQVRIFWGFRSILLLATICGSLECSQFDQLLSLDAIAMMEIIFVGLGWKHATLRLSLLDCLCVVWSKVFPTLVVPWDHRTTPFTLDNVGFKLEWTVMNIVIYCVHCKVES